MDPDHIVLDDYEIWYKGFDVTPDADGQSALVLTLDFTNNGKEATSYLWAVSEKVFLDGIGLNTATVLQNGKSKGTVAETQQTEIMPGKTIEVKSAYSLPDGDKKTLEAEFQDQLLTGEVKIDLNQQAYKQPSVKASKELKKELKSLNGQLKKYRKATITYTFGNTTETLDSKTVNSWISIQGTKIIIDQEQAGTFISQLANKYNTIYVPRTFHTSMGTDVTVEDNEYGYRIDQSGELSQLLSDLKSGKNVVREPVYSSKGMQRNGTDDLAGSYIEVSLDAQHLWLYKDGGLVTETDIVSGAPTEERHTYTGAWPIAYKASPFTLTSDAYGYDIKVKYWMPFVYGQGLHDAPWQSAFGGNRYKTGNGSHGCINLPEEEAVIIYENIDGGYPIIIY